MKRATIKMASRKTEPGKSATTAPPKRLALSDKTAQAVLVQTEVRVGRKVEDGLVGLTVVVLRRVLCV